MDCDSKMLSPLEVACRKLALLATKQFGGWISPIFDQDAEIVPQSEHVEA